MTKQCSISGCLTKYHAKGFCQHHYEKRLNNSVPQEGDKVCTECGLRHYAKGLCKKHYSRAQNKLHAGKYKEASRRSMAKVPARRLLNIARARAKQRNQEFSIELADITIPKFCPVLGIPLDNVSSTKRRWNRASLDRVDPSKGYVRGNIAVISWRANYLKGNATLEELEALVKWLKSTHSPNMKE